jgi:serine/threonine-protein kinase
MKACPLCKKDLKDQLLFCPYDGNALVPKSEQDTFIDSILDEKYRIEEKIGEGGMGKVYKATHILMDIKVAIKILHPHLSSDTNALGRFRREARAAAQIRHPNAVAVIDFGVAKDTSMAYLVMEFLEGIELREKMKRQVQLGYEETFLILDQVCSAVQAAHLKGIIHRDLKPDNIWLLGTNESDMAVKVLDFGIAKLKAASDTGKFTQQGMIVGTPYYMSPEQSRGEDLLDARSDIYSLGIILYEMLTGDVPFRDAFAMAVVHMHSNVMPKPLHHLRADISRPIERVVLKALQKEKEARQESAIVLAQEFKMALYESSLDLKVLGPRTSNTPFFGMPHALDSSTPAGLREKDAIIEPASVAGIAHIIQPDQPASLDLNTPPTLPLKPTPDESSLEPTRPLLARYTRFATAGQPKALYPWLLAAAAVVAILVIGLIIGINLWTQHPNKNQNTNRGDTTTTSQLSSPMVLIPGGRFTMGNNASNDNAEKPEHIVSMKAFYIDQHEVTNAEYAEFVKVHPERGSWNFPEGQEKYPVVNVSWYDAVEYAKWAGKRLPMEEEWEYAARWTDKRIYPWGNPFDPNYANTKESGKNYAVPVGSYPGAASRFNVLDMAGNVAEWTASDYEPYPGSQAAPIPGNKIVRGGSFFTDKTSATTTSRRYTPPDRVRNYLGFRCAKDAPQ